MATNCNVVFVDSNGDTRSIHVKRLGFPGYFGRMLLEHYQDASKAKEIVELGNLFQLGRSSVSKIPEDKQYKNLEEQIHLNNHSVSYIRDIPDGNRLENAPKIHISEETAILSLNLDPAHYTYLWKDNTWYFRKWRSRFEKLSFVRISHDEEEDG